MLIFAAEILQIRINRIDFLGLFGLANIALFLQFLQSGIEFSVKFVFADFDPAFFQFTVHIQDELVLAVRSRDAERARDLRRADLQTFQRYLYRRLGWSELSGA